METNYEILLDKVRELGMDYRWARMFVKSLRNLENDIPIKSNEKKKWAMKRGFYPARLELYGLTENNYKNFVPDYQYFMLHPLNNHFRKWLDKTTLKYVLNSNGCEDTMPEYYVYVENEQCGGKFTYLMDCPDNIPKDEDFLWNLLQQKRILAMKPNSGTSGGLGFIKLELRGDDLFENNEQIDLKRFEEIRDTMRNYVITEYVHQHNDLDAFWSDSECTLRIIMCKYPNSNRYAPSTWVCPVSYARFGSAMSGGTSNLSAGGVGVGFDYETGICHEKGIRLRRFTEDGNWKITKHPDTQKSWYNFRMPNWDYVKNKISQICQHLSSLDYMGLDIIITNDGMKLCEINTHPSIGYEQIMCGPTLKNEKVRCFFKDKGLYEFNGEDFWQAYKESQDN